MTEQQSPLAPSASSPPTPSSALILQLRDSGLTFGQIALRLGITRNRVAGVVWRAGKPKAIPRFQRNRCQWLGGHPTRHETCDKPGDPWCDEHRARVYQQPKRPADDATVALNSSARSAST